MTDPAGKDNSTTALPEVALTYFLWLPAGKDEFGFNRQEDAPLFPTAYYRTTSRLERTIATHFEEKVNDLSGRNKLAFMEVADTLKPSDGELGLRKIQFNFTYNYSNASLAGLVRNEPIPGTAIFYSNGLYLWSFRMPLNKEFASFSDGEVAELKRALTDFLANDFVRRHISHLFDFPWNPDPSIGGRSEDEELVPPDNYRGILTYYQLDLLFNGVFDPAAHPHLFMGERSRQSDQGARDLEERARQRYGMRYLIESISLCAFNKEYTALFDKRKEYTVRRTHGDDDAYVDSGVDLTVRSLPRQDDDALHARELFVSRLAFAAMEQFLRVGISFGLTHYKAGLSHIRAELISQGMESRRSSRSSELRRPSLRTRTATLTDLEAYYALLSGKLATLSFLYELVLGLAETTAPAIDVKENGIAGAVEWRSARKTLTEAQTQFGRMINALKADREVIESSFEAVHADQMLLELTESRKLSEIAAESTGGRVEVTGGSIGLNQNQLGMLMLFLGAIGVAIGVTELFSNVGVAIAEKAYGDSLTTSQWGALTIGYWSIGLLIAAFAVAVSIRVVRKQLTRARAESANGGTERNETHVFDYSSLMREVAESVRSAQVMQSMHAEMIDLNDPGRKHRGSSFSTVHETPSNGIERIKYSLAGPTKNRGLSYVLHVEFDRRLSGDSRERLLDIRLVVRGPASVSLDKVIEPSHRIIAECVKGLLFPSAPEGDLKKFCKDRFGWELLPTAGEVTA